VAREQREILMKTTVSVKTEDAQREWWVIDLEGQTVGRAAAKIASVLRGKHKPTFTPHNDTGDFVVAINADKVVFTGKKWSDKMYYRHSNHPGGLTETTAQEMLDRHPERIISFAVKGMLPKNKLGRSILKKFKVYAGAEHPHEAQQPKTLSL
jgi:large subunit ribosomal protein L13